MPTVYFTENLRRHLACDPIAVSGTNLRTCLFAAFEVQPRLQGYLLDDQQRLRPHVNIYIDGEMLRDRHQFSDAVKEHSEIYVMQALSGG